MRITIELETANNSEYHQWLDRILHKIDEGWHLWEIGGHEDSSAFEETSWIRHRGTKGDDIIQLFRKSSERELWFSRLHNRRIKVTNAPLNEDDFLPQAAARFAETPLCIIVENQINDGRFITRVINELDSGLSSLLSKGAVYFDSIGGISQMPELIKNRVHAIREQLKADTVSPRLIAIADSDKESPTSPEGNGAIKLRKICTKYDITCWILAKRTAENYLPAPLLKQLHPHDPDFIQKVSAWESLTDDQKDFYNMKKGFSQIQDDRQSDLLFDELSEVDFSYLKQGFGDQLNKCWNYDDAPIETELRERSRGDLEYGIALILKEM